MRSLEEAFPGAIALFIQGGAGDLDPYVDVQPSFAPVVEQGEILAEEAARITRQLESATSDIEVEADPLLRYDYIERSVARYGEPSTRVSVGVGILQVGTQLAFVALPGEPFVDLQLSLKQRSPVQYTFLLGYTNGYAGYLPTLAASIEGGYGADYGHTLHLEPGTGEKLIDIALSVLRWWAATSIIEQASKTPCGLRLGQPQPNPFNAATTIAFELDRSTSVTLDIFNLNGARLRTLVDGSQPAGRHRVRWDGRDETGRSVATGVYLVQLRGVTMKPQVRKMLLVK